MRYKAMPLAVRRAPTPGPTPTARRPRSRSRDWAATLPILLLIPALVLPIAGAEASGPRLRLDGMPTPGARVTVIGRGFLAGERIKLRWDGSGRRMPAVAVNGRGRFRVEIRIPAKASLGSHRLSAIRRVGSSGSIASNRAIVAARLDVTVHPKRKPVPAPTASPSPAVVASPSPSTLTSPVPEPTPTPTGTPSTAPVPSTTGPWEQRPYAADGAWNTSIPTTVAVDSRSSQMMATLTGSLSSDATQYSYPVYVADASTPRYDIPCTKYRCTVVTATGTSTTAVLPGVPIPAHALPSNGTDGQMIIIDSSTGTEYDLWQVVKGTTSWSVSNGSVYNVNWSGTPSRYGSRGAGVPYLAGLVRPWEIAQGRIDHAIAFAYPGPAAGRCVFPASKTDGANADPNAIPEGARLQLDPSLGEADFDRLGLDRTARIIARALQRYGMIVIDRSGRPKIYAENVVANTAATPVWSDPGLTLTSTTVASIPLASFRVLALPDGYWTSATGVPMHGACYR